MARCSRRGRFTTAVIGSTGSITYGTAHGQWDIEHGLAFRSARLYTFSHHFSKLAIKFSLSLRVALIFWSRDDDMFFVVRFYGSSGAFFSLCGLFVI